MHKEIRLPVLIDPSDVLAQKSDVIRPYWPFHEGHLGFLGSLTPLPIITPEASAHEIFPGILASAAAGHDVIDGEHNAGRTTILATMTIAPQNILA